MICGGKQNKDACGGDSGGPLIANIDGKFTLVGVTSWGSSDCGSANNPGVYADISNPSMMRFINRPMRLPNPLPNPSRTPPANPGLTNNQTPMCQPNAGTVTRPISFQYDIFDSQASVISTSHRRSNSYNGNRIIGGVDAHPGEVPWQVNIFLDGTQLYNLRCGGTLVSSTVNFPALTVTYFKPALLWWKISFISYEKKNYSENNIGSALFQR